LKTTGQSTTWGHFKSIAFHTLEPLNRVQSVWEGPKQAGSLNLLFNDRIMRSQ